MARVITRRDFLGAAAPLGPYVSTGGTVSLDLPARSGRVLLCTPA